MKLTEYLKKSRDERTTHLHPNTPCENGLPVTPERLARHLDRTVAGILFPVCGNHSCSNLNHWFFALGDGRREASRWKELRVLAAHASQPNLSVRQLALAADVSPTFVRRTLERNDLSVPKTGLGPDGKSYSTTRAQSRLRALVGSLKAALPYLEGPSLDCANELLETLEEKL